MRIDPLPPPESADDPCFAACVRVTNASYAHEAGADVVLWEPDDVLSQLRDSRYRSLRLFVARDGDEVVGCAHISIDNGTERDVEIRVCVDPARRGDALADALYSRVEAEAIAAGRSSAVEYAVTSVDGSSMPDEEVVRPSSGIGGVPRADARARTLLARGYSLGNVERASTYARPADTASLARILDEALAFAGPAYEAVWWSGLTPDEHLDSYAQAISRMSVDVPTGDIAAEENVWDAGRVRARDERQASAGRLFCVAAAVHRPTRRVVAFNELVAPRDRTVETQNYGTLVLPEHRGRRLGTVVKALGLIRWLEAVPESPAVITFNAEENRYMLDVNERVGFRPRFWEGAWSKQLA